MPSKKMRKSIFPIWRHRSKKRLSIAFWKILRVLQKISGIINLLLQAAFRQIQSSVPTHLKCAKSIIGGFICPNLNIAATTAPWLPRRDIMNLSPITPPTKAWTPMRQCLLTMWNIDFLRWFCRRMRHADFFGYEIDKKMSHSYIIIWQNNEFLNFLLNFRYLMV